MPITKKKSKRWNKEKARGVTDATKRKVKHAKQIQGRKQLQESRREGARVSGRKHGQQGGRDGGDAADDLRSVDDLFASVANGQDDDLVEPADDDDESSAGAFEDGGGSDADDDDLPMAPGADGEDGDDAKHAEELQEIKEKDPEFYKFLVEQDPQLLDFNAPEPQAGGDSGDEAAEGEGDDDGLAGDDVAGERSAASGGRVVTKENLLRIQASAKTSFTAFKAALNIYHSAIRSIEVTSNEAAEGTIEAPESGKGKRRLVPRAPAAPAEPKGPSRGLFRIESEAIFQDVLEWSVANLPGLLKHHAGELKLNTESGGKKGKHRETLNELPPDPQLYSRFLRVQVVANIFWKETAFLINHLQAQPMLEHVLKHISTPEALSWLWPFKAARKRFQARCSSLWAAAPAHNVRLMAFLFLRNSATMAIHRPDKKGKQSAQLEELFRQLLRAFATAASQGYSWRSLSTFRFMENCFLELLRLDDTTTYRIGYVCVRQLALILRNATLKVPRGVKQSVKTKGKKDPKNKSTAKQKHAQLQADALVTWPFIRALSLWTKAISNLPALRPLAYPLSMVTLGAVKSKLTGLAHYPFVAHCLQSLNSLGATAELFVPIASHLLKALGDLQPAIEKAFKKASHERKHASKETLDSSVKAPELEVILRLTDAHLMSGLALEEVGSSVCSMLTDHLGLLSQSPAFPEISVPILVHLRRHSKHMRSDAIRKQLKNLVLKADESAAAVRAKREALTQVPSDKKLLFFPPDTALAKARIELLKRRSVHEKGRVQAEVAAAKLAATKRGPEDEEEKKTKKKRKATEQPEEVDEEKVEERAEKKREKRRKRNVIKTTEKAVASARAGAKRIGALADKDKVEEFDFSDGE